MNRKKNNQVFFISEVVVVAVVRARVIVIYNTIINLNNHKSILHPLIYSSTNP